jgi:hypothetical protein
MAHPEYLRRPAERMLALAMNTEDETLVQMLTRRASDHLDEATALEAGVPSQPNDPEKKNRPLMWAGLYYRDGAAGFAMKPSGAVLKPMACLVCDDTG